LDADGKRFRLKGMAMKHLAGFRNYLNTAYEQSVFERALAVQDLWACHLHTRRMARLRVTANLTHDLQVDVEGEGPEDLPKLHVKLLYPAAHAAAVAPLIKFDPRVRAQRLKPFLSPAARHHVKNKSLFVLMKDRDVVVFTLLEGEVVRGIIGDFNRYDITVNLKGGLPVVLLRHSIYDLRNKRGRCYLKSSQDTHRDWQKSEYFVPLH
jgi:hypothetical protein